MLFNRFFKQPKPNKFGYTPVYFDERKIERDKKIAEAKRLKGEEAEVNTLRETINFRNSKNKSTSIDRNDSLDKFRNRQNSKSNRMTFFIILIIAVIIYAQFTL